MENKTAVAALAALAQETRLSVFRLLVEAGPKGLPAGESAKAGSAAGDAVIPSQGAEPCRTRDFTPGGRFVYYAANFEQMAALMSFLTQNCCHGMPQECLTIVETALGTLLRAAIDETQDRQGADHETLSRPRRRRRSRSQHPFLFDRLRAPATVQSRTTRSGCSKTRASTSRSPSEARKPASITSGFQVDSEEELTALREQVADAEIAALDQPDATCCYARSDKYWITDPQGIAWETYRTLGEARDLRRRDEDSPGGGACCAPRPQTVSHRAARRRLKKCC